MRQSSHLLSCLEALEETHQLYRFVDDTLSVHHIWTAGELVEQGKSLAGTLRNSAGPVILYAGAGPDPLLGLIAIWYSGRAAVPTYPAPTIDGLKSLMKAIAATTILCEPQYMDELAVAFPETQVVSTSARAASFQGDKNDLALILFTSGSTSAPKGVPITHQALWQSFRWMFEFAPQGALNRICTWLPQAHVAGLYTRLLPIVAAGEAIILDPKDFSSQPNLWLEAIERFECTFSAAPDFAYNLLAEMNLSVDLSSWKMMVSGGEKVRAETLAKFTSCYHVEGWSPYYGMTETLCTSITYPGPPTTLMIDIESLQSGKVKTCASEEQGMPLVSNGKVLGGTGLLIVDPNATKPASPGEIGEIWVSGETVLHNYLSSSANSASFGEIEGKRYFRTGDLGFVHRGEVYITGRLKELLIIRGKNHYPTDIEQTVKENLPLANAAVFNASANDEDSLGLAVEVPEGVDSLSARQVVKGSVAEQHGLHVARLFLLPPGYLPRTSSNKISRNASRTCALNGDWTDFESVEGQQQSSGSAPISDEDNGMVEILRQELSQLSPRTEPIRNLGLDSLMVAQISVRIHRQTGVNVPIQRFFDGTTGEELLQEVISKNQIEIDLVDWSVLQKRSEARLAKTFPSLSSASGVLLTGATGFLGRYLLRALIQKTNRTIYCLVRAGSPSEARKRLSQALATTGEEDFDWSRIRPMAADVTLPNFGLSSMEFEILQSQVGLVLHNAANVDFVAPYKELEQVNADATSAMLDFVTKYQTIPIHFVSTQAIFNTPERPVDRPIQSGDFPESVQEIYTGYAQSKWVSEMLLKEMASNGLPVAIHRPGLVVADTESGFMAQDDFLARFISGCIRLARYPNCDVAIDMMAVNDLAESMVASMEDTSKSLREIMWTYADSWKLSQVLEIFQALGYPMAPVDFNVWIDAIRLESMNPLFPLLPFLSHQQGPDKNTIFQALDGMPLHIDDTEAAKIRSLHGLPDRAVSTQVIQKMARWMETEGLISVQ